MITNDDVTKLKQIFLTREEFREFKDELFLRLDIIAGYMKKSDEEQTVMSYRLAEHSDAIEQLDTRVTTIETCLKVG